LTGCHLCGPVHTAAIHAATVSIRGWLKERIDLVLSAPAIIEAPKRQPVVERAAQTPVRLNRVERMRSKVPKQRRTPKPKAAPRHKLTGEYVLAQLRGGKTTYTLARELGMHPSYVSRRLHEYTDTPEGAAAYAAMVTCGCKRVKRPEQPACCYCRKNAERKAARMTARLAKKGVILP
jgi:AraC-like DNA-binding protein